MKKVFLFIAWLIPVLSWSQTSPGNVSSNIQIWLKADSGPQSSGGSAANGDAVDTWQDQSGARTNDAANNLADANYGQPTFRSNAADNINYNPVVDFDGADGLDFGNDYVFSSGTGVEDGMTWLVVVQPDSASAAKDNQVLVDEGFYANNGYGAGYGYSAYFTYTSTGDGGAFSNRISHTRGEANTIARFEVDFGNTQTLTFDGGLTPVNSNSIAGLAKLDASNIGENPTHINSNGPLTIGAQSKSDFITSNDGRYLDGSIAEVIAYNRVLTATELRRVETYLALKYGITLDNTGGGVAGDYEATNGVTIWDASVNAAYHNDIIGIGRDDDGGLLQLQSHTSDDSSRIYMDALSIDNASNAGSISNDTSYIVFGHNGASKTLVSTETPLPTIRKVEREWKITNTSFSDSYAIDIELEDASAIDQNELILLVDTDTDFSDASYFVAPGDITMTKSGNVITITGLSTTQFPVNATRYFTIGVKVTPGSVGSNIAVWLKASEGVKTGGTASTDGNAVDTWEDQSFARTNSATNTLADANYGQPTFRSNATDHINYNPVVDFDGMDGLDFGNDYVFSSGTGAEDGMTWLVVVQPDSASATKNHQVLLDEGFYANAGYGAGYGYSAYHTYTSTDDGGVFSNRISHTRGETTTIVRFEVDFGNTQTLTFDGGLTPVNSNSIASLAKLDASNIGENPTHINSNGPLTIGAQSKSDFITSNDGRYLDGSIAEVIAYNRVLTATELRRVETYLALKYGITLDNSDGGAAGDYEATNGVTIWDASVNAAYHNDIIGLGRDDDQGLLQKQSHQADDTTRIYLSVLATSNSGNSGSFSTDGQFLIAGHNGEPILASGSAEYPSGQGIYSRIDREWKITNTNFDGTFSMDFIVKTASIDPSHLRLLIDTDGDFTDATVSSPTITYSGGIVTVSGITTTEIPANSTRYITITSVDAGTTLPVELIAFTAVVDEDKQVQLDWQTASEMDNDYFTIERSANGEDWVALENIKGAGYSSQTISYGTTDRKPYPGISFYRLKQTDFDGQYAWSDIRRIEVTPDAASRVVITPNPSGNWVSISADEAELQQFQIFNINGQEITDSVPVVHHAGKQLTLDISSLPAGMYVIKTMTGYHKVYRQ